MPAGRKDRRIQIQEETLVSDGGGGFVQSWSTIRTVWTELVQQSGREFVQSDRTATERRAVFRLHWLTGITTAMRVVYGGEDFNIREVRELGRRDGLELHCEAIV